MTRPSVVLLIVGMLSLTTLAQEDKPKVVTDPIADELKKAKQEYQESAKLEISKMLTSFDEQRDKLAENKNLKVEELVKLDEKLRSERKTFASDPSSLPQSAMMKGAVAEFRLRITTAKKKCEVVFNKAAEAYRTKKDLASAKSVIADKEKFFTADAASTGAQNIKIYIKAVVDDNDTITVSQSGAQWGHSRARPQNVTMGTIVWDVNKYLVLANKGATEFLVEKVLDFSKIEIAKTKGRGLVSVKGAKDRFVVTISDSDAGGDEYEMEIVIKK